MMKILVLLVASFTVARASAPDTAYGQMPWTSWWGSPIANKSATVISAHGTARFTVLTPDLLRIERAAAAGTFLDGKSIAIWNRDLPVPEFSTETDFSTGITTITTSRIQLQFTDSAAAPGAPTPVFSDNNLRVTRLSPSFWPNSSTWVPSCTPAVDGGQLFGTFHALDASHDGYGPAGMNCSLMQPDAYGGDVADFVPCDFGLLSKTGFALVDDSKSAIWDEKSGWVTARPGRTCPAYSASSTPCFPPAMDTSNPLLCASVGCCWNGGAGPLNCSAPDEQQSNQDWYLFSHGVQYSSAVADYASIAGAVPIPRRSWMGVSWSRWDENNTQADTMQQLSSLAAGGWPLDSYIFDMQWHRSPNWGGYEWDGQRYDNMTAMLASMHDMGLFTGMNLHDVARPPFTDPAYSAGVVAVDNPKSWPAFAAAMGVDPSTASVDFNIGNRTYAVALHEVLVTPLLQQGLDMCWTDFQHGFKGVESVPGLLPTAILNHYRFYNCTPASGLRGTHHSRYAGRGDHRHASAFGGDVQQSWQSLQFMIDFTRTAANTPLCWWGHEMMRSGPKVSDGAELFTRTNQFGAWSPIFTSWGNVYENNLWWDMQEPFASAMRESLKDRQQLLPYRYSAAATAHSTGLCSHRGMHFSHPLESDAYHTPGQFLLGNDIIVAPAFSPVQDPPIPPQGGSPGGVVGVSLWVPPAPDAWVDFNAPATSAFAPGWMLYNASIFTVPVLARAGAVIPLLPRNLSSTPGISGQAYSSLTFRRIPGGSGSGSVDVYEDDGSSTQYLSGVSATTRLQFNKETENCDKYQIQTLGFVVYDGMERQRSYALEVMYGSGKPLSVSQNDRVLAQAAEDGVEGSWFAHPDHIAVYLNTCDAFDAQMVLVCT